MMDLPPMIPQQPPPYPHDQIMSGIQKPHNNDVLCGRGVTTNRHPGNESFRSLVNCNKEVYVSSTKKQKMNVSRSIVEAVRSLDPPGRFLEKDNDLNQWFDIGDKKAVEKTSQALRDGAAGLRKQLSEDLGDPEFLSAVFDMDVALPDKKSATPKKTEKKAPPKKGHRRTKSSPIVGMAARSKSMVKKAQKVNNDVPMSPRSMTNRMPMIPKPPQSPCMSPRTMMLGASSPRAATARSHGGHHRRAHSQGSAPPFFGGPVNFRHSFGQASRSNSFEYAPENNGERPYSVPIGSSSHYRRPMSPSHAPPYHPPSSPRSYHQHHHQPFSHHGGPPVSPRWSPRSGYARGQPPPGLPPSSSHSFSPYPPPIPPPSNDCHRGSASPVFFHHRSVPRSPHEQYSRPNHQHHPHPQQQQQQQQQQRQQGQHPLAVPSLGADSARAPSPRYRRTPPLPLSPTSIQSHSTSPLPLEFTPPTAFDRPQYPNPYQAHGQNNNEVMYAQEHIQDRQPEPQRQGMFEDGSPFDEHNLSSVSPSAVADVGRSESEEKAVDDPYPSDENPDANPAAAAVDDFLISPLPMDHCEDPMSLMELPENILSLPISMYDPSDFGEI